MEATQTNLPVRDWVWVVRSRNDQDVTERSKGRVRSATLHIPFDLDLAIEVLILIFLPLRSLRLCVKLLFSTQRRKARQENRKEEKKQIQIAISNA